MRITSLFSVILMCCTLHTAAQADPLLLTDAEMKKLQQYFPAEAEESHLTWKGDPLAIQLPVGKEKRIIFPTHVTFDAKGTLATDQLQIINNDKSLYLTALKPLTKTRVYITLQDSNEVVLLDLITTEQASTTTTTIDVQQNNGSQPLTTIPNAATAKSSISLPTTTTTEPSSSVDTTAPVSDGDVWVALTRYAWQQLFSPERLLKNPLGITRVPMKTQTLLSTLIYGDKVYAHPLVSWFYQNTYITVIELRNKYPHVTTLNVAKDVCGQWQAATVYPRGTLKPSGEKPADSTYLFLISSQPFSSAMELCNGHA